MGMTASLWPADVSVVSAKQWPSIPGGVAVLGWPHLCGLKMCVVSAAQRPGLPRNVAIQGWMHFCGLHPPCRCVCGQCCTGTWSTKEQRKGRGDNHVSVARIQPAVACGKCIWPVVWCSKECCSEGIITSLACIQPAVACGKCSWPMVCCSKECCSVEVTTLLWPVGLPVVNTPAGFTVTRLYCHCLRWSISFLHKENWAGSMCTPTYLCARMPCVYARRLYLCLFQIKPVFCCCCFLLLVWFSI